VAYNFTPPQQLQGSEKDQLKALYSHLFKLSNELNNALNNIEKSAVSSAVAATNPAPATGSGSGTGTTTPSLGEQYSALRSLVIKSAATVEATMTEIRETLTSDYLAISDFGTFQENLTTTIQTTAQNTVTNYDYSALLKPINDEMAGFSAYQVKTEQYIKIGIVGEDENGVPIAGIVIGKNLAEVIVDGETYVSSPEMYSCFTANRLSFWQSGVEQAYISNETLYVTNISATNSITVGFGGNKWVFDTTNGLTIRNV
jgi:hypothetical protein